MMKNKRLALIAVVSAVVLAEMLWGFGSLDANAQMVVGHERIYENGKAIVIDESIKITPPPFKQGELVYGIDVSKYQNNIDWANIYLPANAEGKVTTSGGEYAQHVYFAFMKATEGKNSDPYYARNYASAKQNGIVCGAYHFFSIRSTVDEQVENFIRTAKLQKGDLPPVLDLELPDSLMKRDHDRIIEMALEWLKKIEKFYHVKPIIYTYNNFIPKYLTDKRFKKYEFWIARYGGIEPDTKKWQFWQFTDQVRIPAIKSNSVDVDLFKDNLKKFKKYIKKKGVKKNLEFRI